MKKIQRVLAIALLVAVSTFATAPASAGIVWGENSIANHSLSLDQGTLLLSLMRIGLLG